MVTVGSDCALQDEIPEAGLTRAPNNNETLNRGNSRWSVIMSEVLANQGANPAAGEGTVRKLWPTETDKFRDHMLRLDKHSRRMRFAHSVSDSFIEDYSSRMAEFGSVVYAFIADGRVRAAAELRRLGDTWGEEAEAAFSVEKVYQDQGIGSELMGRIVRAARNRGIRRLYLSCLAENSKMQAIARKHEADLRFEYGEVIGEILPDTPNYFSILAEAAEDRVGFMIAVLELQSRMVRAA
jgi:RimJ/RimL family protein N-acetyltransferase